MIQALTINVETDIHAEKAVLDSICLLGGEIALLFALNRISIEEKEKMSRHLQIINESHNRVWDATLSEQDKFNQTQINHP